MGIPESLSEIQSLVILDLSHNNLTGPIPTSISKLINLQHLILSNNTLEGEVPGCLWRLSTVTLSHNSFNSFEKTSSGISDGESMRELDLSSNSLGGPFPHWICKSRFLKFLDLSNNLFSGSIPPCFENSTFWLKGLVLRNNSFSGVLPDVFVNASMLFSIDVSYNKLEGKLPKSLINCNYMELVNVGSNRIKDTFPSWLGSLTSLRVLILRSNAFYGSLFYDHVPVGLKHLRLIDISQNDFSGALSPLYFSNWHEMVTSVQEENDSQLGTENLYMGEDGPEFSHSNSMTMIYKGVEMDFPRIPYSFRAIDFSGNRFCGNIPESIGLLKELRLLNLSGNAFTSNIPQSLANLTNLETLDLSRNRLSGHIPRDFGSLSFLSTMNFSFNLLQGPVPQGTQFQSQTCSSFMGNLRLYGLEKICAPDLTPRESEELSEPEEHVINWIAAAIAYGPGVFCGLVIGHIFASLKHEGFMGKFHRNKPIE